MKSYNKELNEFLQYIFDKFDGDERICEFKDIYINRQQILEERKLKKASVKKTKKNITISQETAIICTKLISSEIEKNKIFKIYPADFMRKLNLAEKELKSEYANNDNYSGLRKLIERFKAWTYRNT